MFVASVRIAISVIVALAVSGASTLAEESSQAVIDQARARAYEGDTLGAIAYLQPYVAAHRSEIAAARLLGDLYFRVPDVADAEKVYRGILQVAPKDRETHNRLGGLYAAQDRVDEALAEFEKSLPSPEGFFGLVELHRRKGDLRAFERDVHGRADDDPLDWVAQANYGNVLRAMHRFADAYPYFHREYRLNPSSCIAANDLANAELDLNRTQPAIELLRGCLVRDPNNYAALVNLGETYIELNDNKGARTYLNRALAVRSDGPEALIDIGYLEDVGNHWKKAIEYYLHAIGVDPLARDAYVNLGYDYNEHQMYALAEAAFLKGLSVAPSDGRLHYMLAVTYNEQGKIELARRQYERALESDESIVVHAAKAELALLPPQH